MSLFPTLLRRSLAAAALTAALGFGACQTYYPPPEPSVSGAVNGILPDAKAPLVVQFSEPIRPETLNLKVIVFANDPGEQDEVIPEQLILVQSDGGKAARGGTLVVAPDGLSAAITYEKEPPVGPRLALLVEPGLTDLAGHHTNARRMIQFGYAFSLAAQPKPTTFPSGAYFILLDLQTPIATQLKVWGDIHVDAMTGKFHGQFTHSWRDRDPSRCPGLNCNPTVNACTVYPAPKCVAPSQNADSVDEYPDWVVDTMSPGTFSVTVEGSVEDRDDGSIGFGMLPVDVSTKSPNVTVKGISIAAQFTRDPDGALRGTGSASADTVLFLGTDEGHGSGLFRARLVAAENAPKDIPPPP